MKPNAREATTCSQGYDMQSRRRHAITATTSLNTTSTQATQKQNHKLTPSRPRQLRQPQTRIIRRAWLKRNIAMPLRRALVLRALLAFIHKLLLIQLIKLHGADCRDLRV